METKSDRVRYLTGAGYYQQALGIAKDFRLGLTEAESNAIRTAYECMVHERFYRSLGYDLSEKVRLGIDVLKKHYGKSEGNDIHQSVLKPGTANRELHSSRNHQRQAEVSAQV